MTILLIGFGILGFVRGLIYLTNRFKNPTLAHIVHGGLIRRLAMIAAAMIVIGTLLVLKNLLS